MHVEEFLDTGHLAGHTGHLTGLATEPTERSGSVDFTRAKDIEVSKEMYLEAESRGMTLSELLETPEYDLSEPGAALDSFERQLALAGIRIGGRKPSTVEAFFQSAPAMMPEFIMREIRRGMAMRPELDSLVAKHHYDIQQSLYSILYRHIIAVKVFIAANWRWRRCATAIGCRATARHQCAGLWSGAESVIQVIALSHNRAVPRASLVHRVSFAD